MSGSSHLGVRGPVPVSSVQDLDEHTRNRQGGVQRSCDGHEPNKAGVPGAELIHRWMIQGPFAGDEVVVACAIVPPEGSKCGATRAQGLLEAVAQKPIFCF